MQTEKQIIVFLVEMVEHLPRVNSPLKRMADCQGEITLSWKR